VLEKMTAENKDLQHLAKRACVSYLRSVHLMKDRSVFKVSEIDAQKLATSYGLLNAPKVEVVSKKDKSERVAMLRE
jgi:ATP-dependent RNA helicase DDX10/DBP4